MNTPSLLLSIRDTGLCAGQIITERLVSDHAAGKGSAARRRMRGLSVWANLRWPAPARRFVAR